MSRIVTRRTFLSSASAAALAGCVSTTPPATATRPNVILIITDDQGYGDMACHGHPALRTPNIDALHAASTRFTRFHVMPVCSPTRACLLTGRYNYRTGVVDTFQGRSMMHADETTLAEILRDGGYRTGIFGKWHLGDNYPLRAMDQGFEESLVHRGGGLAQPSDPPGSGYFNPILSHNGELSQFNGYCTDIFTAAAMEFIGADAHQPFFCYLATNAPHIPLEIDERYVEPYRAAGIDQQLAKFFGMIANFDENLGRLLDHVDALGLRDNTLVIFMTDNGSQVGAKFFNAGMRGNKGTVYEGGIRVPFFMRWPGVLEAGVDIDGLAAHIDVVPTLAGICGCPLDAAHPVDGVDLMPLARGASADDRFLFFQWHRGDRPERFRDCAVLSSRYKLVNGAELYDLLLDPGEVHNIATFHPHVVQEMRDAYDAWFADVGSPRHYQPPRIVLGTRHENPSTLTRQDWRGAVSWHDDSEGYWEVAVARGGRYRILGDHAAQDQPCTAHISLAGEEATAAVARGAEHTAFELQLKPAESAQLKMWIESGDSHRGMRYVHVERL